MAAAKAGRMIREELQRLDWSESDLRRRRRHDLDKLAMAVRRRRETTRSIRAIAARGHLGTSNTAHVRSRPEADASPVVVSAGEEYLQVGVAPSPTLVLW